MTLLYAEHLLDQARRTNERLRRRREIVQEAVDKMHRSQVTKRGFAEARLSHITKICDLSTRRVERRTLLTERLR